MTNENLKTEIESISEKTGIPIHYIEHGINEANRLYLSSNAVKKNIHINSFQTPTKNISESIFGVNLGF